MLTGTIDFQGETLDDVALAIEEAARRIAEGFTSGKDSNESGAFSFAVDGEEGEAV